MKTRWFSSVRISNLDRDLPVLPVILIMARPSRARCLRRRRPPASQGLIPTHVLAPVSSPHTPRRRCLQPDLRWQWHRRRPVHHRLHAQRPPRRHEFLQGAKMGHCHPSVLSTFAVTFASSVYVSGIEGVVHHFDVSEEGGHAGLVALRVRVRPGTADLGRLCRSSTGASPSL